MLYFQLQFIGSVYQGIGHIQSQCRTTYRISSQLLLIENNSSIRPYTFQTQKISLSILLLIYKFILIHSRTMKITMCQLPVTVIIIPIMRNGYGNGRLRSGRVQPSFPMTGQLGYLTPALYIRLRETYGRTPHRFTGGNGNPPLLTIINRTIEMINYPIVFYHIAFMCKHLVILLAWNHQIRPFPICPMHQVITRSKRIERLIPAFRMKGGKIKHHIYIPHFLNMGISRNCTITLVCKDRIAPVSFPAFHVFGQSNSNTFAFQSCIGVSPSRIVKHNKGCP